MTGAGGIPVIVTERDRAIEAASYKHAGMLSAEEIISGEADKYLWLEPKVLEIMAYVQSALVHMNRGEDLAKARTDPELRKEISKEIDRLALTYMMRERSVAGADRGYVIACVINEIIGLGPLEPLWQDPEITEVICNGPLSVYVERSGRLQHARGCRFRSQEHLLEICQRIMAPLNRKIDVRDPLADGRLPDGSRVNVVHHALAPKGPLLTIRRFPEQNRSLLDLVNLGSMDKEMATLVATLIHNKASTLVVGGTGSGKALDVSTPIPTVDGFVNMGDLKVGDFVFDEKGRPTRVEGAYDIQMERPCYEVEFSDGTRIIADAEHLWGTYPRETSEHTGNGISGDGISGTSLAHEKEEEFRAQLKRAMQGVPTDAAYTIEEIATLAKPSPSENDLRSARAVTLTLPQLVEEEGAGVRYLAGNILHEVGEGVYPHGFQISTTERLRATLRTRDGHHNHIIHRGRGHVVHYQERTLYTDPYLLGRSAASATHQVSSEREAIPRFYEVSSVEQRQALLAGIVDEAGESDSAGGINITLSNRHVVHTTQSVLASLGYFATLTELPSGSGEGRFVISFLSAGSEFRDPAKAALLATTLLRLPRIPIDDQVRFITAITPVASRPVRCIRVATPSHLFLAGRHYVPTHNTTLLNALSAAIPRHERVITIEDALELRLHPDSHVASMEARPVDATGGNSITIRNLVKNALRMRPDRIIVGEIRDSAALDMLQACNTGHEGSMSTVHANGPDEAISRLTVMVAQGGEIPADKVEWLISSALDLILIAKRYEDGSRRVAGLYEVPNSSDLAPGESLRTIPLWEWEQTGVDADGKLQGHYVKRNDISDALIKARGLDHGRNFTWDDVVALSADKPPQQKKQAGNNPSATSAPDPSPAQATAPPRPTLVPPRPTVTRSDG